MSFNSSKISNGITVLSYDIPYLNTISINLLVKVGSRYEEIGEWGIAHFLEHMAFKGTYNRTARDIAEEFDMIGGHFNAYTSKEHTVYHTKLLAENLENGLEIIADIIQNSSFDNSDIYSEYNVICQEIASQYDNPDELAYDNLISTCFKDQPLGKSILGTTESISNFSTESFKNFVHKHYYGENIIISVAGKIDHPKLVELVQKLFISMPSGNIQNFQNCFYIDGYNIIDKKLEQTSVILGFESSGYDDISKFYYTQIMSLILGGGISSRLFQKIREEMGLAYSVGSFNNIFAETGVFSIYAGVSHDNVIKLIKEVKNQLNLFIQNLTDTELQRAKSQVKANIFMAQEKSSYKAEEIAKNYALYQKYIPNEELLDKIMSSKIEDITNVASVIFNAKPSLSMVGSDISPSKKEEILNILGY